MEVDKIGDLLTKEEVTKILKVSDRTVDRLCEAGKLVKFNVSENAVRITGISLRDYLNKALKTKLPESVYNSPLPQTTKITPRLPGNYPVFISVANHKGGVGKSELVKEIGAYFTMKGKRVLLVDCDPQGNLSSDLDWYPISEDGTILPQLAHVLDREPIPLKDVAKNTVYPGLDIIPNSVIISPKEHEINSYMYREELLKRYFKRKENEELTATYDYVIFDNPPSANILVVNSLIASDFYLIPIQATRKALEGTFSFQSIIARIQEEKNIFEIGKVLTFWDNNRNEPKKVEKDLNEKLGGYVFKTKVRNLAEISSEQMPKVLSNKRDSEAKKDMTNFCEEFEERLNILIQSK